MPKDNENVQLPFVGPLERTEPHAFSHDQMIRCEQCLRANPPTRIACLYCNEALPQTESSLRLRVPTLRRPEKFQPGYNSILLPIDTSPAAPEMDKAAALLKLTREDLQRIISSRLPLPLARTASREEAQLVHDRLDELGIDVMTLSDRELGLDSDSLARVRGMSFDDDRLTMQRSSPATSTTLAWSEIVLIVSGRLVTKRIEVTERKSRKAEADLLDTDHYITDEAVIDLYSAAPSITWRIGASSFDFSCLGEIKTLLAGENIMRLRALLAERSPQAAVDESYNALKLSLNPVWVVEQETQSRGWKRERPGKVSLGAATIESNEDQFTRYSRLRYFCMTNAIDSYAKTSSF